MSTPEGSTAGADDARHSQGFPDRFYDLLAAEGLAAPGMRALDLGTGTGTLARGLARRGLEVLGLDPAAGQLAEARRLAAEEGLAGARFAAGLAERTGQPEAAHDLVIAGQSWHWFDRGLAAAEARRVLRPGGALVIAHLDWLPLPGSVAHASEYLIEAHNPRWRGGRGNGFYPGWAQDLWAGGFEGLGFAGFDLDLACRHEDWRGRVRASAGIGAEAVTAFDAAHARLLAERFPEEPLRVPHRVFAIWGRRAMASGGGRVEALPPPGPPSTRA